MTSRGFTLLEIMIALAILSGSLLWLIEASTRAIVAENHAKLLSTATFLARARIVELEDELGEKGFADDAFGKEESGDFEDKGFKRFHWTVALDKVELPNTDQMETLVTKGMQSASTLGGPSLPLSVTGGGKPSGGAQGALGGSAGMLASQFGLIKDVLEHAIRRARVKITWTESKREQSFELVEYLTDPRRVDQAVQIPTGIGTPGGPGQPGQPPPQNPGGAAQSSPGGGK